ncbi:LysR family transcriptional regulator [Microbulbifer sp. ARAS458-1]|uniref:LysR family transcriptional regulator n=1 Tax=Microbulbifer sp. ARAS458-1 TaxID=3140242 RepID=UPI0038779CC7
MLGNLNGIRIFEAAARHLSFKRAAEELHLTPTAVSHQIRKLEEQLGVPLFERHTRAVSLTDDGRVLLDAARLSLRTLAEAIEQISESPKRITVSTTNAFAALWLVPQLPGFRLLRPDVEVVIQASEVPVDLRRNRTVDLAIRYGLPLKTQEADVLCTDAFAIYGIPGVLQKLRKGESVPVFETRWQSPNLPTVSSTLWWERFLPELGMPSPTLFDQEIHVIQAALAGQGVAFVSNVLVESAVAQGWLEPLRADCLLPGFAYYCVTEDSSGKAKITQFQDWLKNALSKAPD